MGRATSRRVASFYARRRYASGNGYSSFFRTDEKTAESNLFTFVVFIVVMICYMMAMSIRECFFKIN
jgi:hypothetical protein